jgi:hypothetical protein
VCRYDEGSKTQKQKRQKGDRNRKTKQPIEEPNKKRHLNTRTKQPTRKLTQRRNKKNSTAHNVSKKSSRERKQLTISHQLSDLLVLSAGDLDIVDCHHDSEELVLWSACVLIEFIPNRLLSCLLLLLFLPQSSLLLISAHPCFSPFPHLEWGQTD